MAEHAVLTQLAQAKFKELHYRRSDGSRQWDSLAAACRSRVGSDRSHQQADEYMDVFDFAVQNRFGCWVLDYVAEVCGDTRLTSDDPLEAQLLDGTFVKAWCQKTLHSMEGHLHNSLKSEAALSQYSSGALQRDCQAAEVVVSTLKSLGRIRGSAAVADARSGGVVDELQQALQLQRVLQLVQWCVSHQLHTRPPTAKFASLPDWTRRVQARRDKRPTQEPTCLDDLISVLASALVYPFPNPTAALASLASAALAYQATFNHLSSAAVPGGSEAGAAHARPRPTAGAWCVPAASTTPAADPLHEYWQCCLALYVYYMTDRDELQTSTPTGQQLLSSFQATFQLPSSLLSVWCSAPLLDDFPVAQAGLGQGQSAGLLQQAASQLLTQPPAHLHVKFLKVFCALNAPDVALALDRARQQQQQCAGQPAQSADDAWALVECRLRCGLVAEAVALSRSLSDAQPDAAARTALLTRLLRGVLDWAGQVHPGTQHSKAAILELCCGHEEESILVSWLHDALLSGSPTAHLLPVTLATRGRIPEALAAFQLWSSMCATNPAWTDPARSHVPPEALATVQALVDCVAEGLPLPLRNVVVEAPAAAGVAAPEDLLRGLSLQLDPGTVCMRVAPHQLALHTVLPPALVSTAVVSRAPWSSKHTVRAEPGDAQEQAGSMEDAQGGAVGAGGLLPAGLSGFPAGGSTAFVGAPSNQAAGARGLGAFSLAQGGYASGGFRGDDQSDRTSALSFLPGPPTSSLVFGGGGQGQGQADAAGATRPLFALTTGPVAQRPFGFGVAALDNTPINKRARPNTWSQN